MSEFGHTPRERKVFFVGRGEFPDQNKLADRLERRGAAVGRTARQLHWKLNQVKGCHVIVVGSQAEMCVSAAVVRALYNGAELVGVPLQHVRTADRDGGSMSIRAHRLFDGITNLLFDPCDSRLHVTPDKVWKKVLRERSSRKR